ncbi:MAG: type I glyceraldehyde-3-phosphate dehydrogenase, partial [Deltaproteobacteria bacterium]|nr:type I glyceraldehyde-3-phosphate dehydrogenase [Deltaproteobacteria bacterium]
MVRVGINGFGRIGRQVLKAIIERQAGSLEVAAINDLFDVSTNAHLFKHDTAYGRYPGSVEVKGDDLVINGQPIKSLAVRDPAELPWDECGVEIVIES